jgi:hypothetical protein
MQGNATEAKDCLLEAYKEDKITFGEEKAKELSAKKALDSYFSSLKT